MSAGLSIASIFDKFGTNADAKYNFTPIQQQAKRLIALCKTHKLGSHIERCDSCGHKRVHYNSCGNRNCPNCQGVNKEKWLLDRDYDLLPVKYFHVVFTVPSELRPLFRFNQKVLYDLLFRAVKETLFEFGMDPRQKLEAKLGMIAILHTWNQQMQYHPHLHCIVPAGGIDKQGNWKESRGKDDFLFSVKALSDKFKKKFLILMVELYKNGEIKLPCKSELWNTSTAFYSTKSKLYDGKWVVYAKEAFGGPKQVLEYLGRYTHRIAISNYRIEKVDATHVTFRYLDRKNNKTKYRRVKGEDFIALFLQHVLPKRFVKIRHYGFLSSRNKKVDLQRIRKALGATQASEKQKLTTREVILKTTGVDPYKCPKCKTGTMVVVKIIPGVRGSPRRFFASDKTVKLAF